MYLEVHWRIKIFVTEIQLIIDQFSLNFQYQFDRSVWIIEFIDHKINGFCLKGRTNMSGYCGNPDWPELTVASKKL